MNHLIAISLILFTNSFFAQDLNYHWHHGHDNNGSATIDVRVNESNEVFSLVNHSGSIDADPSLYTVLTEGGTSLSLIKYTSQREYDWSISLSANVTSGHILLDDLGNIYVYGRFQMAFDAEPGSGITTLSPTGFYGDSYIIKLSDEGQFIWAHALNSNEGVDIESLGIDDDNNIYMSGNFRGIFDANPGIGINTLSAVGWHDIFIVKWDENMNYISSFSLGGATSEYSKDIVVEGDKIFLSGRINGGLDFDPSLNDFTLNASGGFATFISKYDTSLNFIDAIHFTYSSGDSPEISSAGNGNIILASNHNSDFDADPSASTFMLTNTPGVKTGHVISLDTNFNFQWAFTMEAPGGTMNIIELKENKSEDIFIVGRFTQTYDFDPGLGTFNLTANSGSNQDNFIARYNSSGQLESAYLISNTYLNTIYGMDVADLNKVFISMNVLASLDCDLGVDSAYFVGTSSSGKGLLIEYSTCTPIVNSFSQSVCKGVGITIGDSTYYESGVHKYTFENSSGCDSVVIINLTVTKPNVDILCAGDTLYCGDSITPSSYQWYNCSQNSVVAGETNPFFTPQDNSSYSAIVSSSGCIDTSDCIQNLQSLNDGIPVLDWASSLESSRWGDENDIVTDQYGNFYVCGQFNGYMDVDLFGDSSFINRTGSSHDLMIMKYNNNGVLQWAYPVGSAGTSNVPEIAASVAIDKQGNVFAAGTYVIDTDFNPDEYEESIMQSSGETKLFLIKLNASGQLEWSKNMGSPSAWMEATCIALSNDGNIAISGNLTANGNITADMDPSGSVFNITGSSFIAKYDPNGNLLNAFGLPSSGSTSNTFAESVTFDNTGSLIFTGTLSQDFNFNFGTGDSTITATWLSPKAFVASYDENFNFEWVKSFSDASLHTIRTDCFGNPYIGGSVLGTIDFSGGSGTANYTINNSFVVKYDSLGTFLMVYQYSAITSGKLAIDLDPYGNLYVAGRSSGDITFGAGNTITSSVNKTFVAKYKSDGTNSWGFIIEDDPNPHSFGIATDNFGNVFLASDGALSPFDVDPSSSTYNLTSSSGYIAKYGQSCSSIDNSFTANIDTMWVNSEGYFEWKRCSDGFTVESGFSPYFTPQTSDNYYAVINMGSCSDSTACVYLQGSSFIQITSNYTTICENDSIQFSSVTQNNGTNPNFQWYINGTAVIGANGTIFSTNSILDNDSIHCISVSNGGTDTIVSNSISISVLQLPIISLSNDGYTISSDQSGAIYQWLDCNSGMSQINGEISQDYTPPVSGDFAIEINLNGCVDTSLCELFIYLSIEQTELTSVLVYPNPSKSEFTIESSSQKRTLYYMYNMVGEKVLEFSVAGKAIINSGNISRGIYIISDNLDVNIRFVKL